MNAPPWAGVSPTSLPSHGAEHSSGWLNTKTHSENASGIPGTNSAPSGWNALPGGYAEVPGSGLGIVTFTEMPVVERWIVAPSSETIGPPGQRIQIILLDTRYFRTPLKKKPKTVPGEGPYVVNPDPQGTVLGSAQWKWLEEQLRMPAKVRLLVSSIQLVPEDHNWEKWLNHPIERERLFKLIRDTKAGGVIALSDTAPIPGSASAVRSTD